MKLSLSLLAVLLGTAVSLPSLYCIVNPAGMTAAARRFPRSLPWGYALMALGTAWFLYYFKDESVSDFAVYKPYMFAGFVLTAVLTCLYVTDFLAVRGLAIVLLLLGKLMVDTARWAESTWSLVIVSWAYILIVAGIWFTVSPWRLRDLIHWATANESRARIFAGFRLAFGLLVIVLGLTVL